MTAEELIIGHYERTLSPDQEAALERLIEAEPEVRSLYEQHGTIDGLLVAEAETIETTSKLDKVVIGAALGTLIEIAGKGVGISLLGKIAAVVATVAVGTVGYVLIDPFGADEPARPEPAVRSAPAPTIQPPAAAAPTDTAAPSIAAEPVTDTPRPTASRQRAADPSRPAATRPATQEPSRPSGINLHKDDPVNVPHPPRLDGGSR